MRSDAAEQTTTAAVYHIAVRRLTEEVLAYIRRQELLRPGDRVGVAVSGGADSVALLRILLELGAELGVVLSVVHFNHGIRGAEADQDEAFVAALAQAHGLEFHHASADTPRHAREHRLSLEAAGRELRYQFFRSLLKSGAVTHIATAHTLDDQAETVLLRFLRGAGTRGLAGIYPKRELGAGVVVRPLLGTRRQELRAHLQQVGQMWREDLSNLDVKRARNRIRHELLPLLERDYNPALAQVLAESAEVARAEEEYWEERVIPLVGQRAGQPALDLTLLRQQPPAMQRRLVRRAAEVAGVALDFHHVEQVLVLAAADSAGKEIELPGGYHAVRRGQELGFERRSTQASAPYEHVLAIPGEVRIPALGLAIRATRVEKRGYNRDQQVARGARQDPQLFDPRCLGREVRVRNWRPGDRYRPAHSKSPKKLKELLQERHIPRPLKPLWPVVASGDRILWVPGFEVTEELRLQGSGPGILLEQVAVAKDPE